VEFPDPILEEYSDVSGVSKSVCRYQLMSVRNATITNVQFNFNVTININPLCVTTTISVMDAYNSSLGNIWLTGKLTLLNDTTTTTFSFVDTQENLVWQNWVTTGFTMTATNAQSYIATPCATSLTSGTVAGSCTWSIATSTQQWGSMIYVVSYNTQDSLTNSSFPTCASQTNYIYSYGYQNVINGSSSDFVWYTPENSSSNVT
jgi:ribosome modulation factor